MKRILGVVYVSMDSIETKVQFYRTEDKTTVIAVITEYIVQYDDTNVEVYTLHGKEERRSFIRSLR